MARKVGSFLVYCRLLLHTDARNSAGEVEGVREGSTWAGGAKLVMKGAYWDWMAAKEVNQVVMVSNSVFSVSLESRRIKHNQHKGPKSKMV